MKTRKNERKPRSLDRTWVTIRLSQEEKERLLAMADFAGLTVSKFMVSEFIRRKCFGGRPLTAHADLSIVTELRKLGGLFKHNSQTLREANAPPGILKMQEETLIALKRAIDRIGMKFDTRQREP